MENNKIIIVEGPQGSGKSTLANYLKDNIVSSNLYRLSNQKDKTVKGLEYNILMYDALFDYLKEIQSVPTDLIFDGLFMTEEVCSRLGFKEYSFNEYYKRYINLLNQLKYNIYYFNLYLNDTNLYEQRLKKDFNHNYQSFSLNNSINQQITYNTIVQELSNYDNINIYKLEMDDFEKSYSRVRSILNIK